MGIEAKRSKKYSECRKSKQQHFCFSWICFQEDKERYENGTSYSMVKNRRNKEDIALAGLTDIKIVNQFSLFQHWRFIVKY